jgi:hypothetical protein
MSLIVRFTYGQSLDTDINNYKLKPFGIGINVELPRSYSFYLPSSSITLTFNILDKLRIEPEVGIRTYTRDEGSSYKSKNKGIIYILGTYGIINKNKVGFIYGLKLGYSSEFSEYKSSTMVNYETYEAKGILFGPVIGIEYFFSEHFTIAGEIFPNYYSKKVKDYQDDDIKQKEWITNTGLKFRFYL